MPQARVLTKREYEAKRASSTEKHRIPTGTSWKPALLACAGLLLIGAVWLVVRSIHREPELDITYGPQGVQTLRYNGIVLEDLEKAPSDLFHIWHMKATDMNGKLLTDGQYGWGENNNGKSWDQNTHTWTYNFNWGSISVQFQQAGSTLNMVVNTVNNPDSGITFDGASIFPFGLNFPQLPNNFNNPTYAQLAYNTTGPSVTVADFGAGEVAAVAPDAKLPLYSGFWPSGSGYAYFPIISSTTPDNLALYQPRNDRPVLPGQTSTYTVSLRFARSGTPAASLGADAYRSWAERYPPVLNWTDRRSIGSIYLASSPSGDPHRAGGFLNNPRRYFNDSGSDDFDVTTGPGLAKFQARILRQANTAVGVLRRLNAQGSITWDIEGEQYPQPTSYACAPDQIAQISPEMESTIADPGSPYRGMKLDDAYFKIFRDAQFRVGLCVRPQHFQQQGEDTAQQNSLPDTAIADELIRKVRYAHDRWGATLFYVDSTVEPNGAVLDAAIFQKVAAAVPDSLLIPEESTPRYYAYTAPFKSFMSLGAVGTDPAVNSYYPHGFSVVQINDADRHKLAEAQPRLTQQVRQGDILMVHGDWWQPNNSVTVQIYRDATSKGGAASAKVISSRRLIHSTHRMLAERQPSGSHRSPLG